MDIAILGAGKMGGTMARLLARAGHAVTICNSRGPATLQGLVEEINAEVGRAALRAATPADTARAGEVIVLAVPWHVPEALPAPGLAAGKIVVDAMNPYAADRSIVDLGATTSSEVTARRLPRARLVKALNAIWYVHLATRARPDLPRDARQAIPVAGDDEDAKRVVMQLIEDIGFAALDTGSLREGGSRQQPGAPLYGRTLTGSEARAWIADLAVSTSR
jgi:predicted dinucleotide-binding enzyme